MEEQIITVETRTKGEKCGMTGAEIPEWYKAHILGLPDTKYGTTEVRIRLKRTSDETH